MYLQDITQNWRVNFGDLKFYHFCDLFKNHLPCFNHRTKEQDTILLHTEGILHDISNAITAARLNMDLALMNMDKICMKDAILCLDNAEKLLHPHEDHEEFSFENCLHTALKLVEDKVRINKTTIETHTINQVIKGKKCELTRVLVNIVDNAINATQHKGNKGHIVIKEFRRNNNIIIEIKDNGVGISKNDIGKIWQNTYSTKGKTRSGMGLYITKQIIQNSFKGSVHVKSKSGKGTLFIIVIPDKGM